MLFSKQFIIFFVLTFISFISMQLVYAQTVENEIIENTLETVEKAATEGLAEITESASNTSKSIATSTENATEPANNNTSSQAFQQIEHIATDMGNASESAIDSAKEEVEKLMSGANDNK